MQLLTHKNFDKAYAKLPDKVKAKFKLRRNLFLVNEFNPVLNNHPLSGEFFGFRSINITGDYRAIYMERGNVVIFLKIGTHSELY